ncbi:hypothetical protein QBX67_27005 [Bacillus sp. LS15-K4]|nr:hypothetical protein [Bacillus sp. LS15-K4]MDJ1478680.1 hypothetical protein [Bacillus sp. LS15-K4]
MLVRIYQPDDVFKFWLKIHGNTPGYFFDYITTVTKEAIRFAMYVHHTKDYREEYRNEAYEHFIKKRNRIVSFRIPLLEGEIVSNLYMHEIKRDVLEVIECQYSLLFVEDDPNVLLDKIRHQEEEPSYDYWVRRIKEQRLRSLF